MIINDAVTGEGIVLHRTYLQRDRSGKASVSSDKMISEPRAESDSNQPEVILDHTGQPPLVPEGVYQARFDHHETTLVFGTPKVFLWFEIIEPGEQLGKRLYRPYRAKSLDGRPGKWGKFKLHRRSELLRMLIRILQLQARPDRISLRALRGHVFKVKVRTVRRDYRQNELMGWQQYSVIADVVGKETG
jgi:hypothetical protein